MDKCKVCNGDGYHDVGNATVYECTPCNSTGRIKTISTETFNQIQHEVQQPSMPTLMLRKLMRRKK